METKDTKARESGDMSGHLQMSRQQLSEGKSRQMQGKAEILTCVRQCFAMCKTYGKTPSDLEMMAGGFIAMLAEYPTPLVVKAFETHVKRSPELPTLADIVGLIERHGRPPVTEAMYITAARKRGDDRTDADWQVMRDFEAAQERSWRGESLLDENKRLRAELAALKGNTNTGQRAIPMPIKRMEAYHG